ncbi:MAG: hypothetical protein M3R51_06915 [Candidatus Eremiobacteraeota bacterium]|nr:hypothetical protein [Candidatus Eremiobacteraeota bacterium]
MVVLVIVIRSIVSVRVFVRDAVEVRMLMEMVVPVIRFTIGVKVDRSVVVLVG